MISYNSPRGQTQTKEIIMRDKIAEYEAVEAAAMKFVKSVA